MDKLADRYYLWHHAMKRLVPEIMVPDSVIKSVVCNDVVSSSHKNNIIVVSVVILRSEMVPDTLRKEYLR